MTISWQALLKLYTYTDTGEEVPLIFVSSTFTQVNAIHSDLVNEILKNEAVC